MSEVQEIFKAFGNPTALSTAIGVPMQTAWDWRNKSEIPPWRRPSILDASKRLSIKLPEEAIAYLASSERRAKAAA